MNDRLRTKTKNYSRNLNCDLLIDAKIIKLCGAFGTSLNYWLVHFELNAHVYQFQRLILAPKTSVNYSRTVMVNNVTAYSLFCR